MAQADEPEPVTTLGLEPVADPLGDQLIDGSVRGRLERLRNRLAYGYTRTDRDQFNPTQANTRVTFDAQGENRRYEYQGVLDLTPAWIATFGAEREDAEMRSASAVSGRVKRRKKRPLMRSTRRRPSRSSARSPRAARWPAASSRTRRRSRW